MLVQITKILIKKMEYQVGLKSFSLAVQEIAMRNVLMEILMIYLRE